MTLGNAGKETLGITNSGKLTVLGGSQRRWFARCLSTVGYATHLMTSLVADNIIAAGREAHAAGGSSIGSGLDGMAACRPCAGAHLNPCLLELRFHFPRLGRAG
jgi:hypothetical protein